MITLHNKQFNLFISQQQIKEYVKQVAAQISHDFKGQTPLLLPLLNGAFMFAADLMREITLDSQIAFARASSYQGTASTGKVHFDLLFNPDLLRQQPVIIVEDIIDTGHTIARILPHLQQYNPPALKIACLLHKPDALQYPDMKIDYIGVNIENKFVVGYGLDYDELGRNYPDIYQLAE